jgi:hypothetical protein
MRQAFFLLLALTGFAIASPDEDWNAVRALDAGPGTKPKNLQEARALAKSHLQQQEKLVSEFLEKNPSDPRSHEARMRLASLLAAIGKMENRQSQVDEAMRLLQALEKEPSAPREVRAEAGFRRVSLLMQSLQGQENERRRDIVTAARNFQNRHPGDRRAPRLLVEVATICDNNPPLKRELLDEARRLSSEPALNRRIADDLRRLELLDKPFALEFSTIQGGRFNIAACRGRIVLLVFWSTESLPSLLWIEDFRRALANLPADKLAIATISLDQNPAPVREVMEGLGISQWPTACDGQGWQSPLVRPYGINALPTILLLDQKGTLRAINARNSYESWIRKLLIERN